MSKIRQRIDRSKRDPMCERCHLHPYYPCPTHVNFLSKEGKRIPKTASNWRDKYLRYQQNYEELILKKQRERHAGYFDQFSLKVNEIKQQLQWDQQRQGQTIYQLEEDFKRFKDEIRVMLQNYNMILRRIQALESAKGIPVVMNHCPKCECTDDTSEVREMIENYPGPRKVN